MSTDKFVKLEYKKVQDIAREYRKNGYEVFIEPNKYPKILRNIRPDLVAMSNHENVAIEIVSRNTIKDKDRLTHIAKVVEGLPGWRFEMVITNPKGSELQDISENEIISRFEQSRKLISEGLFTPGLLNSWGATEALLRKTLDDEQISSRPVPPIKLIKNLFSFGVISRSEFEVLEDATKLRNSLIHGYEIDREIDLAKVVEKFIDVGSSLITRIINEKSSLKGDYTVDELVEWFHENYKDPANGVPFESAEGGYIYINGGPYDAWDELWSNFPDADENIIEEAAEIITIDGNEWVKSDQY